MIRIIGENNKPSRNRRVMESFYKDAKDIISALDATEINEYYSIYNSPEVYEKYSEILNCRVEDMYLIRDEEDFDLVRDALDRFRQRKVISAVSSYYGTIDGEEVIVERHHGGLNIIYFHKK